MPATMETTMSDQRQPLSDKKAQEEFDKLPLHIRSMLMDEMRQLTEVRELPDPTPHRWF